jgi:chromosome segregation protein
MEKENKKLEDEKKEAQKAFNNLNQEKFNLDKDLKDLLDLSSNVVSKINEIKPVFEKKRRELDALSVNGLRRLSPGVRQVLAAGKAGQLKGVVGLISDLFQCEEKYQAALEVAAGAFLVSIVTKNADDSTKAIEFLRKGRIGRVSFIPKDKILPRLVPAEVNKLSSYPGVVGFASDLAKFDKELEDVFRFVLGGTLVVADLSVAKRIGIGRARMVTLSGDLCDRSGLMVGGYYKPMRSTGRLEAEVVDLEANLKGLEEKRNDVNERILKLRQTIAEIEVETEKLKGTAQLENFELKLLREREEELEKSLSEIGIKKMKKEFSLVEQELSKIKPVNIKELKDIDERSAKITENESELRLKLNNLKNESDVVENEIANLNSKIENNKKMKIEALENIKKLNSEIEKLDKKIKTAKKSTSTLYGERENLEDKRMEFEKLKLERYQKFGGLNEDLKNRRTSLIGLEYEIREQSEKLKEYDVEPDLGADLEPRLVETIDAIETMGAVNLKAVQEYEEINQEVGETVDKKEKLRLEKKAVIRFIRVIEKNKKEAFMRIYNKTARFFKNVFSEMLDGAAKLGLDNPEDPFDGGLYIEARMHGKRIRLEAMSGGEKSLTALAFIFALQIHAPSPFYLFDEVDAALDKVNSEKLVNTLKQMGKQSQVLIITHNDQVLKACDQLIGVYMKNGISEIVSVKVD